MSKSGRIVVNGRFLGRAVTGVERYAHEAVRRFERPPDLAAPRGPGSGLPGHLWEQFVLPARTGGGVLWSPANTGPLAVAGQVLTIHDPAPLDHPEWFRPLFAAWYRWLWPRLARRVHTVLTVSSFSRSRLESRLGIRVEVIPGGVDVLRFRPQEGAELETVRRRYGLPVRYLLFVGTVQPRKNLAGLAKAFTVIRADFPEVELVVAGGDAGPFAAAASPAAAGIRFIGRVPDAELPALYSGAAAFVQPSFYEGGGLTVLEAMACGCPVAAARGSAPEEVLGGAGLTFDPTDPGEMAGTVGALLEDRGLHETLRAAGIERARTFTWERCAASIEAVLESIPLPSSPRPAGRRRP